MDEINNKIKQLESFAFIHFGSVKADIMTEYLNMIESLRKEIKQFEKQVQQQAKKK